MAINVQIKRGKTESSLAVLSKFTKKIKESGIIPKVKSKRYADRSLSDLKRKKDKLVKLEAKDKYEYLKKMGKLVTRSYSRPTPTPSAPNATK